MDESVQLLGQRMLLHHIDINGFFNIFKPLWQILLCIGLNMEFSWVFHASRALAWIYSAKHMQKPQSLWKVSTQAAYTRWRAQGNSGLALKAISEDAVPMGTPGTPNPLSSIDESQL